MNWWLEINAVTNKVINAYQREEGNDPHALPDVITIKQVLDDNRAFPGWLYNPQTGELRAPALDEPTQSDPIIE